MHLSVPMTSQPALAVQRHSDVIHSRVKRRPQRGSFFQRTVSLRSECSGGLLQVRPTRHAKHEISAAPTGHPTNSPDKYGELFIAMTSHKNMLQSGKVLCLVFLAFFIMKSVANAPPGTVTIMNNRTKEYVCFSNSAKLVLKVRHEFFNLRISCTKEIQNFGQAALKGDKVVKMESIYGH